MRLLIATANPGKVAELKAMLAGLGFEVVSTLDLDPVPHAPDETHDTFHENALLKARYYSAALGYLALADDSGLVVDALDGAPGVHSARYGGEGLSDGDRVLKLLEAVSGVPGPLRTARFVSVIAVVGESVEEVFEGVCEGALAFAPRGDAGFGYDPIFIDPDTGKTFGELTMEEKADRSHRGRALAKATKYLSQLARGSESAT